MNFLYIQKDGDWEWSAMRVKEEGHNVFLYKQKDQTTGRKDTGRGIFKDKELVDDLWEVVNKVPKDDLIMLIDDNGLGDMCDYLRKEGFKVIGGSAYADKIEYERDLGTKVMESIGLKTPPTHIFNNINDGIKFVEEGDDVKYVFKPNGEDFAGGSKTYTAKGKEDLLDFMKWIKSDATTLNKNIGKFELQEFIEGYEADFSGYFDGEKFLEGSCNVDIEEKKSGDGNKGEAVGCMGNIIVFLKNPKYFEILKKLTPILKDKKYVGQISINNIFEKKTGEPYGLEFTPRFGWDAHTTEGALIKLTGRKLSDFYIAVANKGTFDFPTNTVGLGVRVYSGSVSLEKSEVQGRYFSFDDSIKDNLFFYSVAYKDDAYQIEDNQLLVTNIIGKDIPSTIKDMYENVLTKLRVPDIYYRNEIGQRAPEVIRFLHKFGWI